MSNNPSVQPPLADLLAGYLGRQATGALANDALGEVEPYEAGPVHPVDARLAWDETLFVARCYSADLEEVQLQAPSGWSGLVAAHEPEVAVAFALGNFPQMVRHFHAILQCRSLGLLRPAGGRGRSAAGQAAPSFADKGRFVESLAALGTLRLAKEFDQAESVFKAYDSQVPADWRTAWDNERAALAWHSGQAQRAADLWQRLEPTAAVLFNRGMADLFLDRPGPAQLSLKAAVARLADDGAWHHLGRLYLALAQSR